ncbi:hypothetical protein HY213_02940, partial [Candidatus Peregrinibacteria bacterium]|nr:hypothetical protein [Candidatus Peregrinibacteria bacterium]
QAHFLYWGQLNAFIGEMQQAEHRNPTRQELLQEQAKLVADLNAQLAQVNVRVIPLNDGSLNLDWSPVKAGVGKGGGLGGHGDIELPPDGGPNGVGKKLGRGRKEPEPGPGGPGGPEPDRPGEPGPDRPNPGKQEPPGKDNGEGKEEKQEGLIEGIIDIAKQIVKKLRKGSPPQEVQAAETELREFITDTTRLDGPRVCEGQSQET